MLVIGSGLGLISNSAHSMAQSASTQSIRTQGLRSPASLAVPNQIHQAIGELQLHSDAQPPTITLRPAKGVFDSCEVNVVESTKGHGYQLRVAVPDSVSSIEVVPASTSNRQFRIRLEENQPAQSSARNSKLISPLRSPREIQQWMDTSQNAASSGNAENSDSQHQHTSRSRFTNNPFFATSVAGTSRATPKSVKAAPVSTNEQIKVVSLIQGKNEDQYATKIRTGVPQAASEPKIEGEPIKTDDNTIESFVIEGEISVPRKTIGQPIGKIRVAAKPPTRASRVKATPTQPNINLEKVASVSLDGPTELVIGDSGDYTITVANTSDTDINNVNVRLKTREGFNILLIEREANFDQQNRQLVWNIPTLKAG